ncbi:MAG: flippase [Candidatus Bathyarchaeota archaeon]|nr:flippase [Candidatus Termiticorpusculum sp.]
MSKAADLAKTSTKAGFNYLWGLVISTVISSLGTIFIANLLGSYAYGLYGIALTVPNLIILFRDWGINLAMVRYTAQYRAENRAAEIRSIFIAGIIFEITLGLILSLVSFLLSGYLASSTYARPELAPLIQIASFSILAGGIVNVAAAVFTGTEETSYNSVMLVCQSVIKTFLIICLVIAGLGTSGAIIGFTMSSMIAGLIGITFTMILYRKIPRDFSYKLEIKEYTKEMLKYSIPLSLLTIVSGFLAQFYAILLPYFLADTSLIGNYYIALNFVVLISFFALPITNMLFPAFSKLDIKKDKLALKNVFQFSVKYSTLLVVPVSALVMCLSTQAITTLFKDSYSSAPLFLALLAISYLFSATGNLSNSNIINSQGQTKLNLKFTLLTAMIGFPMGYFLIMFYGVFGLIFTTIVAPIPSLVLSLIWIKKHYDLTIDWTSSVRIIASSAIAAILTYLLVSFIGNSGVTNLIINHTYAPLILLLSRFISVSSAIELAIGTVFYMIVLLGSLMLTKTLSINDLNSLRAMTTELGPISKIVHIILNTMEKIMTKFKLI